jgi:2-polyprenyl-6-methoxyphenol hydroxylase-like FAD-dependent oxidoreductase
MARIIVVGGGITGLCAAMLLARDGHGVELLERDPALPPPPGLAWGGWERRGMNQFRMIHYLLPRFRALADVELPDVIAALEDAGGRGTRLSAAIRWSLIGSTPNRSRVSMSWRRSRIDIAGCGTVTARRSLV